jgi:hypothetical protein
MKAPKRILPSTLNSLKPKLILQEFLAIFRYLAAYAAGLIAVLLITGLASAAQVAPEAEASTGCSLSRGPIRHVIYIQFDNTHFSRDNANVPSDLEQMPHLLNFVKNGGTLLSNHHTPLISHTANDILTSLTGVYPDRHGVAVANAYGFFNSDGSVGFTSSFLYWNDTISDPLQSFNMLSASRKNAPAPWVPYTRAGCDVGAVGTANIELENLFPDVPTVFGANSPEAQEAAKHPNKASADFIGIAIHCGNGGGACAGTSTAKPDLLPNEPGGYSGFEALYGHKYVVGKIAPHGLKDLNGNRINGFPGFDGMLPSVSLAYVAAMQESGVPVTYAYVSDAHENHTTGIPYGPGEAGYVAQLKAYDQAFDTFFTRLANDGINPSNTLFVITADEGDHFGGGAPSPTNCNGVTTPCTYSKIGEIDVNMTSLLATEQGITTPFDIHFDMAPSVYLTGNPGRTDPGVRAFERASGKLTAVNPITGNTDNLTLFMADPVELKTLHMITADKFRTPTFVLFGDPDYFFLTVGGPPLVDSFFAWNHGGVAPEIDTTWLGLVGPGVKTDGVDPQLWSDHTDIRPTMMLLLGLKDDYSHDGRALIEHFDPQVLPDELSEDAANFKTIADAYKQINAPVGAFGLSSLVVSTKALTSDDASDGTYTFLEGEIAALTKVRDSLSKEIIGLLEGAEFHGETISSSDAQRLKSEAHQLLHQMQALTH